MVFSRGWRTNHFIFLAMGLAVIWLIMYYVAYGTGITPSNTQEVRAQEKLQERLNKVGKKENQVTNLVKENRKTLDELKSGIMEYRKDVLNQLRSEISQQAAMSAKESHDTNDVKVKEKEPEPQLQLMPVAKDTVIPIVVTACNRPSVSRCLDRIFEVRGSKKAQFPVIVSQDCGDQATAGVLHGYGDKIKYVKHDPEPVPSGVSSHMVGYYKIASHYKFALTQAFDHFPESESIIILEDDIEVAPDFLSYFLAMNELLKKDDTLWCASAWNDNGLSDIVDGTSNGAELLYRSDFFPGLGWLLKRSLWENELKAKWPQAFWDDWMRDPAQRKGRACIRPEVSRTSTFGKSGVSGGQFYNSHLKYIKLNSFSIDWTSKDLSYLIKENYDKSFKQRVYDLPLYSIDDLMTISNLDGHEVRVEYSTASGFKNIATKLHLMTDFKAGVPRTAYMGVVSTLFKNKRVFVSPPKSWMGYNEKW